jgi:PAS domain S-box-containing protein
MAVKVESPTFRAIFDNSLDAILLTRPSGEIYLAYSAACRLLLRTEEEIRTAGRAGLVDASDSRLTAAVEERARTGRFVGELTMVRGDGSRFPAEVTSAVFIDDSGDQRTCTVFRDVSERIRMEGERARMHRLDALRELSVGVRHEMNNCLAALRAELELLHLGDAAHGHDAIGVSDALSLIERMAVTLRRLERVEDLDSVEYLGSTRMLDLSASDKSDAPR